MLTGIEENLEIARRLEEVARLLDAQGANHFRIEAYRRCARTLRNLPKSVSEIIDKDGMEGLQQLPGVGESLARAIYQMSTRRTLPMLERLRGESDPVALLATVPGIGRYLAERIHEDLGIDSLEDLEAAAYDGRLSIIEAIGEKRLAGIRDSLAGRLGRIRKRVTNDDISKPPVSEILDVDREYRSKAARGQLLKIAPRRFNPDGNAWLPILHTNRGSRHYTALFSNTALAHRMNKTQDWLVVYNDNGKHEGQCTVVTAYRGKLIGKRIVKGRETECEFFYDKNQEEASANFEMSIMH